MISIIDQVKQLKRDNPSLTNRDIGKQAGVSEQILSALLQSKYTGDSEKYLSKLEKWLNSRDKQSEHIDQTSKSGLTEPSFVALPTSQRIIQSMSLAQNLKRVALAYEGSGVGKTFAAREYQRQSPNVWVITVSAFSNSRMAVLDLLSEALGIDTRRMTIAGKSQKIVEFIDGANGLIVIDEAQYLADDTLNALRIIADGRAGLALLGNDMVRSRMQATRSEINMRPLWSRTLRPMRIEASSKQDIDAYMRAWGFTDKELIAQVQRIVPKTHGQLRTLGDAIKVGCTLAESKGEPLTFKHLDAAFGYLTESFR